MRSFQTNLQSQLPDSVLQETLLWLVHFRRQMRKLALRYKSGDESSLATLKRLAKIDADVFALDYWWEMSTQEEMDEYFGERATEEMTRLRDTRERYIDAGHDESALIALATSLEHYFQVARSQEPDDWKKALALARGDVPCFFDPAVIAIEARIFAIELNAEKLLRLFYLQARSMGEIIGQRGHAVNVAKAGGVARGKVVKRLEEDARAKIRRYIETRNDESRLIPSKEIARRKRRLSGTEIAAAMIHGEMSELGIRKLADIATEELRKAHG